MNISSSAEVGPPTYDDFEFIKEALLDLSEQPGASRRSIYKSSGLFVKLERLYSDCDVWAWPPLSICLSGLIRFIPGGNKMVLTYRELAHNAATENSSLNHNYIFKTEDFELVEYRHSILACPQLPEPEREHFMERFQLDQASAGTKLLQQNTGNQLELSTGDCGVLFDRMMSLCIRESDQV
jgi:hypothetical protein